MMPQPPEITQFIFGQPLSLAGLAITLSQQDGGWRASVGDDGHIQRNPAFLLDVSFGGIFNLKMEELEELEVSDRSDWGGDATDVIGYGSAQASGCSQAIAGIAMAAAAAMRRRR